jgi:SAM-dependent methyltransferase
MDDQPPDPDFSARVLAGYDQVDADWIERSEQIDCAELFEPVQAFLPDRPSLIADIGAGTGRDAAWLARKGHQVTAVEPVARLRNAGMAIHSALPIDWIDDRLPELGQLSPAKAFDCMLLIGVWQHLDLKSRALAMARLSELLGPQGTLILPLRHGPGASSRPVIAIDVGETIRQANRARLGLAARVEAQSLQEANRRAGVTWTWLAFRKTTAA